MTVLYWYILPGTYHTPGNKKSNFLWLWCYTSIQPSLPYFTPQPLPLAPNPLVKTTISNLMHVPPCPSIPCPCPSIPCPCPSIPCPCPSIPSLCPSIPCPFPSIPCPCSSIPCSCPSIPCPCSSLPCPCPSTPSPSPSPPCPSPSFLLLPLTPPSPSRPSPPSILYRLTPAVLCFYYYILQFMQKNTPHTLKLKG